ncbi:M23 family metallopeptidase [Salinispira pacifica]
MRRKGSGFGSGRLWQSIREAFSVFFDRLFSFSRQRFTVMFIPHSERRVVNFHINTVMIIIVVLVLGVLVSAFFYLTTVSSGSARMVQQKSQDLQETQKTLDGMLSQVSELLKSASIFEGTLSDTLNELNIKTTQSDAGSPAPGDLGAVQGVQQVNQDEIRQLQDLKNLTATLHQSVQPLQKISSAIQDEKQFLTDIPNYWPIIGGRGTVVMDWGPNRHPITGQWFLHKGLEIWAPSGTPVVASANGKVVEAGYDPGGDGFYIKLDHKYGFKTKYSHLSRIEVTEGEEVLQGQIIGRVGSTGVSAGPNLEFQIQLGTEFLDPSRYLKIKNTFDRWKGY